MPTQNEKVSCKQKKHAQLLLEFMDNPVAYYDYFTNLLDTSKAYITADFSPSYSALSITTLSEIKSEFSHRGIRVFPIFLMRELTHEKYRKYPDTSMRKFRLDLRQSSNTQS